MNQIVFDEITNLSRSGATVLFGTDRYGRFKAKAKFGLFKSRIKRFSIDHETYHALRQELQLVRCN